MQKSFLKSLLAVALVTAMTLTNSVWAQLVSSGITGVVQDPSGKVVAGATVSAVHLPTNAKFTAVSRESGRYDLRGLPVGGPFTVTAEAEGFKAITVSDVTTVLGTNIDVNIALKSDVLKLEEFSVTADATDLDSGRTGSGKVLGSETLEGKPTSERSLADMISASAMVTLRSTFGDREESQITAVGQNNRFNSIQIDGARINDQFGLNGTGLASFFNPLSLDTIEQLAVQISPYDVRQAGFTGASINAVTKSGTNQFKGTVYTYFRGNELFGIQMQGENARERTLNPANKVVPRLERTTWGATLGGPIWKNRVFFFLNYEKFESTSAGRDERLSIDPALETQIINRLKAYSSTINWGNPVTGQTANTSEDEKISAKVDWQINSDHRLSVRYTTTEGKVPQFGNYANTGLNLNSGGTGGAITSTDGHFYAQERKEKTISGQFFSQWTPDFKTELRYSSTTQDQLTPVNTVAPLIQINGLTGFDLVTNAAVTNGTFVAGTEQFRHGNVINVDSTQMGAHAEYFWGNFVFSGGFEREATDFLNLFRAGSYGLVHFSSLTNFLNDTGANISRSVYDPAQRPPADISEFATTGIYGQVKWDATPRLTITGGLRYEFAESGIKPAFNSLFYSRTGFRNDGTVDGTEYYSPRVGFNLALDDSRQTQLRGGVGHFLGRSPWVFFSNSYGQTGVGTFTQGASALPTTLAGYLATFNPADPIGKAVDANTGRREINWADEGTEMPQVWRANLALERKLGFLDSMLTLEAVFTEGDSALFITNENLKPLTGSSARGLDGRLRFSGAPGSTSSTAGALYTDYLNLYRIRSIKAGESQYASIQWDRPLKNKWGFNVSYTRGKSTEAQAIGQTTAGGQWNRNVVFNQNTIEEGTADFEIKDRVQVSLTRQFEFVKRAKTTASLYYEGRTGNPYSWVFGSDLNGDGVSFNDTVFVPTGPTDARFDFSAMTAAQQDAFFAFLQSSGLSKYAGQAAPKNAWTEPWVNRLDLKLVQDVPLWGVGEFKPKLQLFFDFINLGSFLSKSTFGYTEIAPFVQNDVFRTRTLTNSTSYTTDGRIRPTFTSTPAGFNIDNGMSRWRIQLGAKLLF